MKALIISTIVLFSLRAISAEVGEDKKGECKFQVQTDKREAKEREVASEKPKVEEGKTISK